MPPRRSSPPDAPTAAAQLALFGGAVGTESALPPADQATPPTPRPTAPLAVLAPALDVLRHPRANRECRLGSVTVAYEFLRSQRRTVGLNVGPLGLSVRAPRWTPLGEVERFLQAKATWVLDKLQQVQLRARQAPPAQVWAEGERIDFLGRPLTLTLDPAHGFAGAGAAVDGERLRVGLSHRAGPEQWRSVVHAWLMREALALFVQRLDHFAPLVGVRYTRVGLSNAGTRWGSARADGGIRLHWRLVQLAPELIDYVVVHELSHLREMNHSPTFWRVVAGVLPEQDRLRRELRRVRLPSD
jgi:predicted metal-dependent hydrolase